MLKNLLEAAELRDTVLTDIDVQAHKVEIEQTQQLLQGSRRLMTRQLPKSTSS
jgi:hypothetical protein